MIVIDRIYESKGEAQAFCDACEAQFEARLQQISEEIAGAADYAV